MLCDLCFVFCSLVKPKSYQREGQLRKTEKLTSLIHVLCYKRQGNYEVCNELSSGTVGWIVARGAVRFGCFVVRIRKVIFFFSFFKFLS